jgi:hypothetical protein
VKRAPSGCLQHASLPAGNACGGEKPIVDRMLGLIRLLPSSTDGGRRPVAGAAAMPDTRITYSCCTKLHCILCTVHRCIWHNAIRCGLSDLKSRNLDRDSAGWDAVFIFQLLHIYLATHNNTGFGSPAKQPAHAWSRQSSLRKVEF